MPKDRSPRRRPEAQSQRFRGLQQGFRWSVPLRLFIAFIPIVVVAAGSYAVMQSSLLRVQAVTVQGTVSLDQRSLAEISGLQGNSMLTLSDEGARRRLLAIPAVRAVDIEREWPNTVVITVVERQPVAYWSVGGHDFPVDQDGVVLSAGAPEGPAPRVLDVTAGGSLKPGDRVHPDAIAFAQRIMSESPSLLEANVMQLEYEAAVGVTVILDSGLRVTFGDDRSYEYKIAVLAELLKELDSQGIQPSAVDLRFGERVTYE